VRFALCDCNNFFVSCERLLRPDLEGKPVIVLSCNDGCVISRSNEAKALGIPMGEPFFKIRALAEASGVTVFSTNFALYHEVSRRVMAILSRYTGRMEVYSVDEAFLDLSIASLADPVEYARDIRGTLLREIGIPVSIGIASTKTLAKLAADRGKKDPETGGVFSLEGLDLDAFLEKVPVGDVWGIGRRCTESLARFGIRTARRLRDARDEWLRRHFSIRAVHTAWELRGISCIRLVEEDPAQKSIQVSRSFGKPVSDLESLREAVTAHAVSAAERLRRQGLAAGTLQVYIATSRFRDDFFAPAAAVKMDAPTSSSLALVKAALEGLDRIYAPGHAFVKAGVLLLDLCPDGVVQQGLFEGEEARLKRKKERALMAAVDEVNRALGEGTLQPALLFSREREWEPKHEKLSGGLMEGLDVRSGGRGRDPFAPSGRGAGGFSPAPAPIIRCGSRTSIVFADFAASRSGSQKSS
jgi:DNA polymerase V